MGDSFPDNRTAFWGPEQETKKKTSDELSTDRWSGVSTGALCCLLQIDS